MLAAPHATHATPGRAPHGPAHATPQAPVRHAATAGAPPEDDPWRFGWLDSSLQLRRGLCIREDSGTWDD